MRLLLQSCSMALRDYLHEGLLSACAVLSLAAVLTPLLVLYGVKFGIVAAMTERMINDPKNLEISPVSSAHFGQDFFAELQSRPDVAFILPRTRAIAATMSLAAGQGMERRTLTVTLEPTAPGDPLLARYAALPEGQDKIVLSDSAARKLGLKAGDKLKGHVERSRSGKVQSAAVELELAAVLPLEAQSRDVAFVSLALLEATEAFRDGFAAPAFNWPGEIPERGPERSYASFRLYARTLDQVGSLRSYLNAKGLEVYTKAAEIEAVKDLDRSFTLIFSLISGAAAAGFFASTVSSALAGVKRKERHLGLIRLLGFPASSIMAFPITQALLTAVLGVSLAAVLYAGAASSIDTLFRFRLGDMEQLCRLLPEHFAVTLGLVVALSALAALPPAARAARIEASDVIRDV
ncbi:MAG: ABC transporter permease [Betaproteobacteria bacterium]|nr:ABC transporter permease [Betaproteobacteria bacterium]